MSFSSDRETWLRPKWLVAASAVAAFVIVLSYDGRLALAAGSLLAVVGVIWIALEAWQAADAGAARRSPARVVTARFEEHVLRRLQAERRARELAAKPLSGAQQVADRS